jgi:enterochelin esterase family protein
MPFPQVHRAAWLLPFLCCALFVSALTPARIMGADDPPLIESPDVARDHRVTFRLEAPQADKVELRGIQRTLVKLTKDTNGVWSVTVGPLAPGIYGYSFIVDGEAMLDPENPRMKPERSPETSLLEVTSANPLPFQWQEVPHGTIRLHDYRSKPLERLRRLRVYTPPGYDANPTRHYPVLYLFHGTGDTEATWTEFGHAHMIIDNLLAEGKAQPMLVVMPDGHADLDDEEGIGRRNLEEFETDLLQSVVPYVDKNYRTRPDADHRAICGLSMGGIQSLFTGLRHPELFSWIGGMSAWVPNVESCCASKLDDASVAKSRRLLWLQIGSDDPYLPQYKEFEAAMEQHQVKRDFHITKGAHTWPVWRGYLSDFAPLLFH